MLERPDGPDLLDTAREVLLNELLPHLPEAQRFHARMVANAMAIARRESVTDTDSVLAELRALLNEPEAEPAALLSRLCAEIRAGRHDPGTPDHAAVAAALAALVRLRCSVSAPKALGR